MDLCGDETFVDETLFELHIRVWEAADDAQDVLGARSLVGTSVDE